MGAKLSIFLPRIAVVVLVALAGSAGLTFAAGKQIAATPQTATPAVPTKVATIVVPDLRDQAFVFAKGQLQDLGFAWRVAGSVRGYPSNTVVSQSPPAGTKLVNTGSPLVTLTLHRNGSYAQVGAAQDSSPYPGTALRLADAAVAPAPAITIKPTAPAPRAVPKVAPKVASRPAAAAAPARRPPDFVVAGARKEPLDEISLPARAVALETWLGSHPKRTNAAVKYWLFQHAWIVTGARLGWWHGAEALRTLLAVDAKTQSLWGIGDKSESVAQRALAEVRARSK